MGGKNKKYVKQKGERNTTGAREHPVILERNIYGCSDITTYRKMGTEPEQNIFSSLINKGIDI